MIQILRDAGLSALVDPNRKLTTPAGGFQFTEGPLELRDGSLLFQDIKAERTYRLDSAGVTHVLRESTGAANGQTFLHDGRIVFCEQNGRRVSTMNPDGSDVRTLVETWEGKRLNSPNDVVCRSDGMIVFTDPPYGAPPDRPLSFQAVFAIKKDGSMSILADDFEKPNGLAFSPDEKTLYVCDTARYHVRAFDVQPDGSLTAGRTFATMDPGVPGGPDGMKVDRDGRVYVAVALGIWVYEPDGKLLGILATPKRPANLAWRGPGGRILAVTAVDQVHEVRLNVQGLLPVFGNAGS